MGSGVGAWASRQKAKALHVGTYKAAIENMLRRMDDQDSSDDQFYLYRVQLDPKCVIEPGVHQEPTNFVGDAYLAEVCGPGTNVLRYVNVHEDPSSVSLAIEPAAIRAVQGIPMPPAVDVTDPWVLDATARLSEATSKPAPRPKGKLQRFRLREVTALAAEARSLESEIAAGLPWALRERFTVGFDEAGFDTAPTVFPTKLVGLARLVTEPQTVLDALDAQPWRTLQASEGEAAISR